jgi:hydroxypyruvate isomerase
MFQFGITAPASSFGVDSTVEGIERAAAVGAEGIEFFDLEGADLDTIQAAGEEHDVEVFGSLAVGAGANIMDEDDPCLVRPEYRDRAVEDVTRSIDMVAEFGGSSLVVTVGQDQRDLEEAVQQNAIVRALRAVAPHAEEQGVTVVPELLNTRVDHPGYFLTTTGQGVEIVEAVDSPNVKILFDVYHQQITEGDVIRRFRNNVDAIGHVHMADNPGRAEPGTGELNYERIFEAIADTGYEGYVSCELSPRGDPDEVFADIASMADRARSR